MLRNYFLAGCFSALLVSGGSAFSQLPTSAWPKWLGTLGNTGLAAGSGAIPSVKWSAAYDSIPVIGTDGTLYTYKSNGSVFALDPVAGAVKWSSAIGVTYPPAVGSNNRLYIAGSFNDFYALSLTDGSVIWKTDISGGHYPTIGPNGVVYVGSDDNNLYALDGGTGNVLWKFATGGVIDGVPAIAPDGTLYVTAEPGTLWAVNPSTGTSKWSQTLSTKGSINSPTVDSAGTIYISVYTYFAAINSAGAIKWQRPSFSSVGPCLIGPNGNLYQGSTDYSLHEVNASTGSDIATLYTGNYLNSFVAIASDGTAYATGSTDWGSGGLWALSGANLAKIWTFVDTSYFASIANDGTLYTAGGQGFVALASPNVTSISVTPSSLQGGASATCTVTMNVAAPIGGFSVGLSSDNVAASVPSVVVIPAGQTTGTFSVTTYPVGSQTIANISATPGLSQSVQLTITPAALLTCTMSPNPVTGGSQSMGTVTLNGVAGPNGEVIGLSCNAQAVTVPSTVTVPAGQTTATFAVKTAAVLDPVTATITVSLNEQSLSPTLTVNPPTMVSIAMSPASVLGGSSSSGSITINGPAAAGGTPVILQSNSSAVTVPASVTVLAGKTSATFNATTIGVNAQTNATITAILNGTSVTSSLTVNPPVPTALSVAPSTVLGGSNAVGTVTLSGQAPPGGASISLASSASAATLPATVSVPAGATTATFTIATVGVNAQTSVTVSAAFGGQTASSALTITAVTPSALSLSPNSVTGGNSTVGMVTLTGPAAPSGTTVSLSTNNAAGTVPVSVTISGGQKSATFTVSTVPVNNVAQVSIVASANGAQLSASLTVNPPSIASLSLNPVTVAGSGSSSGTVVLSGPAGPSGVSLALSSSSAQAQVAGSVQIVSGQKLATFNIACLPVTAQTLAAITATFGSSSKTATLSLVPLALLSITLSPSTVVGGLSSTGTALLNGPAPQAGETIKLSSSLPSAMVPPSVKMAANASSVTFTVKTAAVSSQKTSSIAASIGANTVSAALTVTPPNLMGVSVSPPSITGGGNATGTVTLSGSAAAGGLTVALTSSSISSSVPKSVSVPAGKSSTTFVIKTVAVATAVNSTIQASLNGQANSTTLTVLPPVLKSLALSPSTVKAGQSSTATVVITGPAPTGGLVINLESSASTVSVPNTCKVAAGKTSTTFSVKTAKSDSKTTVTISASQSAATLTAKLTIT